MPLTLYSFDLQIDDVDIAEMMVNLGSDPRPHTINMTNKITLNPFQQTSAMSSSYGINSNSFGVEEKIPYPRDDPWIRDSLSLLEDGRDDSNAWTKKASALRQLVNTLVLLFLLKYIYIVYS